MPKVPTLSSTPTKSTEVAGRAASAASGSQVWTGHIGALIAKAMKKARNIQRCASTEPPTLPMRLSMRKPSAPPGPWKYNAMTPTSMIRPPRSEKRMNFSAAALRRAPPNIPMRK